MNVGENQIVVYQPNETVRLDVRAEIILGLLVSIRKATSERREYGKGLAYFKSADLLIGGLFFKEM